jgi:hypothetical protein
MTIDTVIHPAVVDLPNDANATAVSPLINSTGAVTLKINSLMMMEEIDAADSKTRSAGICHFGRRQTSSRHSDPTRGLRRHRSGRRFAYYR